MLTRETFVSTIAKIKKHEELMDKLNAVCREFGDFRPSLDFSSLYLQALLDVLKEAMCDKYDYISWWLYEHAGYEVSWEEAGKRIVVNLEDVNDFYDFLVKNAERDSSS